MAKSQRRKADEPASPLDVAEAGLTRNNATADPANWPALNVQMRDLSTIRPSERNARQHSDDQIRQIAASLNEWGWTLPLLVDEAGEIIAGEAVWRAAYKVMGWTKGPVCTATGWSEAQVRAYRIAANKLAENSAWDTNLLKDEMLAILGFGVDPELVGFSADDLTLLMGDQPKDGQGDPDAVPGLGDRPISREGDVWLLDTHRVTCGSATVPEDVARALGGVLADAVWTDPPYNVAYENAAGSIKNDDLPDAEFRAFLIDAFLRMLDAMKPGSPIYVAHADGIPVSFRDCFRAAGFKLAAVLIWRKDSLVLGRSDYQWQHEPILYGWKPGARHRWFGGRKQTSILDLGADVVTDNGDGTLTLRIGDEVAVIRGEAMTLERVEPTIFTVPKPKRNGEHPTMKPVELIERMLRNSTRPGDVVLDPFGGSGSTLIACERMGRYARLTELDAKYVDVIVRRWQTFTGKSAVREQDGLTFEVAEHQANAAQGT